jgi:hypothetical protein
MGMGGRRLAVLAAVALLPSIAAAQIIPTGSPAADITLAKAIADWRVFVTCSALESQTNWHVVNDLYHDIKAASEILRANDIPEETIAAFAAAADPEALSPGPDTPFKDLEEMCIMHPSWHELWLDRDFTFLERDLPKAFP